MMNMILPGLWMVDYVPDWFLAPDTHGDYSLSPKRAPDSSWHLPRGLTEEPRPCQCRAQEEVRDAEGSPLMNSGGRAKLDCEDEAWDRRGVNPDGHPGSPLPAPLQDRLRRPAAREHQEVRQMFPLQVREQEPQLHQHRRGAGVRQEDVSPPAVGGQDQGVLHGRQEALLHADSVAQCSEMLLRQLVLLLAAVPNPTHAPVCSSPLLLAEFESTAVVSKRQEDQQVPVWPVPRPRPRRVRGGPVAAREGRLSSSQPEGGQISRFGS